MTNLKGALIGCGFFAHHHARAWRDLEGVDIIAVCDRDRVRASAFTKAFGISAVYDDAEAMLEKEPLDFVDIVTQAATHAKLVALAARYGVNVICQKPLAPTLEEAQAVVQSASNVTLMVHENFRWQRPMLELKRVAAELGDLFYGRFSFRSGYDVYADQPYLATDPRFIIHDLGVHLFDLTRFFLGEAESLLCYTNHINPRITGEDVATVLLSMTSGAHAVVELSYASKLARELFPQTLVHLEGAAGSASLLADYQIVLTTPQGVRRLDASPHALAGTPGPITAIPESVLNIQRHWLGCLRSSQPPDTSGEDNLETLRLVFSAYASADTGQLSHLGRKA